MFLLSAFLFLTSACFAFFRVYQKVRLIEKVFSMKALPLGVWHVIFMPPQRIKGYYYALVANNVGDYRFVLSQEPIPNDFEVGWGPAGIVEKMVYTKDRVWCA